MKVLVCGGRDFAHCWEGGLGADPIGREIAKQEYKFLFKTLDEIILPLSKEYKADDNWLPTDITIISGMARGADSAAADWATVNHAKLEPYYANWNKYKKAAGPIRNQRMLDEGKPDLVIAFPGGSGTAHMKRIAKNAGVKVIEVEYKGE